MQNLKLYLNPVLIGLLLAWIYLQTQDINNLKQAVQDLQANDINSLSHLQTGATLGNASYSTAVAQALPAVVNIYSLKRVQERPSLFQDPFFQFFFNQQPRERIASSLGSGVIVDPRGYLLTNFHVINGADEIIVALSSGKESRAQVIGVDPEIDLAVLKIEGSGFDVIDIADIEAANIGDVVLAIGNPYGLGQTVTQGIISATSRQGLSIASNYIQTDAAINRGNSGGALINSQGELLGINSVIYSQTGANVGIGFAMPVDTAIKVLNDIIRYGKVIRGSLGIVPKTVPARLAASINLPEGIGILVTAIYRNGAAHQAGIMPGDIITHINNEIISGDQAGLDAIAKTTPGAEISVSIIRNGEAYTLKAKPMVRE